MITRVWGKADLFELVFSPLDAFNEQWTANVPADLEDGQYAVELYCMDDGGNQAYWTGMLYLNNSANVKVRIVADTRMIWLEPDIETVLESDLNVWLEGERITLQLRG